MAKRGTTMVFKGRIAEAVLNVLVGRPVVCPHCRAGDPFFDDSRKDHVIRTEAGIGLERCSKFDTEVAK